MLMIGEERRKEVKRGGEERRGVIRMNQQPQALCPRDYESSRVQLHLINLPSGNE